MNKIAALVMIALFLGGAGTGIGGYLVYQVATGVFIGPQGPQGPPGQNGTQGPPGQNGTNGSNGTDGTTGLLLLSGIYEGDHVWGAAIVGANESVTLRNGNFHGTALYVYGNLTMENANLYLEIWPLGNSRTWFDNTKWLGTPAGADDWVFSLVVPANATVTFLNQVGFIEVGSYYFRLYTSGNSQVYFLGTDHPGGNFDLRGQSQVIIEDSILAPIKLSAWDSANVSVYYTDLIGGVNRDTWTFWGNSTFYARNVTVPVNPLLQFRFYDKTTASIWNSSFNKLDPHGNSSITIWTTRIVEVYAYNYATLTLRATSVISDRLDAWNYFKAYLYQSEGCSISARNLYDSAQVITL